MTHDIVNPNCRTTETKDESSQTPLSIRELLFCSPPMTVAGDTLQTRVLVVKTWTGP